ncbi:uncharacterized protein B0H64DRAFT_409539 [Chaetomium fimeti]|uniref:Uncharacterized protein n=1 Tax=Chaetomium fimeti TaxID=1854472 RepID=A0AAE0H7Z7_9PEZI|nr:hypothetical protein B0H64DRAFT_409539 [Chaetomium fimeti]
MQPKRSAADGPSRRSKRSRPSTEGTEGTNATSEAPTWSIPRDERWSPDISGSANVDMEYKIATQDLEKAYRFVCICRTPFYNGEREEEEEDEEEDEQGESSKAPEKAEEPGKCDGGDTCLCNKPASEHPGHIWKLSYAGLRKFHTQEVHCQLRCPDYFEMYTFNRHGAYGVLEVLQNLILDFEEASDNYQEQWAVCEGLAFFLMTNTAWEVTGVDGNTVTETYLIIGRLFLSMLATLERFGCLKEDSEFENLGLVMALFMAFARYAKQCSELRDSNRQSLGPGKDKRKWYPHNFQDQILAYASKYHITLVGPHNIDDIIKKARAGADLPVPPTPEMGRVDPFALAKNLKRYKEEQGGLTAWMALHSNSDTPIGGDNLDITTWSSERRKEKSFEEKDPLTEEHIEALKKGMVIALG